MSATLSEPSLWTPPWWRACAETCVNYLQEKGIAAARLVPVGYGEDALLISDAEINRMAAEDREMAHQRNRRTVFKIIRFDYKPGE